MYLYTVKVNESTVQYRDYTYTLKIQVQLFYSTAVNSAHSSNFDLGYCTFLDAASSTNQYRCP